MFVCEQFKFSRGPKFREIGVIFWSFSAVVVGVFCSIFWGVII